MPQPVCINRKQATSTGGGQRPRLVRAPVSGEGPIVVEDVDQLRRCVEDVERLTSVCIGRDARDPTYIAEAFLEILVEMLDLDFVGIRFNDTPHVFRRVGSALAPAHALQTVLASIDPWLQSEHPQPTRLVVAGVPFAAMALPLGGLASLGLLIAISGRPTFPEAAELLKLRTAAAQASLAMREVREISNRRPPADMRIEKPVGQALAESEWNLNLIINTIPAMAWSATADGILDFCNQHFLDFVGLSAQELMGLGFHRIFHPDDTEHLLSEWQDIMGSKRPREVEGRIRSASGTYRWFTLRQNPLLDPDGNVLKWYGVVLDIEDRKSAEDALKAARAALLAGEQNLRLIVDSLPVLAWVSREDGSAEFVNQRWAEYAGVEAEALLNWGDFNFYHPDDVDRMQRAWGEATRSRDRASLKGRIRRYDGQYRWFFFSCQKITDAHGKVRWVGANVDIEDLQRAEDAPRASEQRLKLIIDTIPAMAWSATPSGEVDFWNRNLLDYCGLSFEDIAGEGFYRIFHPDDLELMRESWERVRITRKGEEIDGRILRADGQYRWFNLRQNPLLDAHGEVVKWYGALIEIEDRKRTEEELRQSQGELARVARVTTLGELAVSIAHEVNQPLMAIVTNAGTCLRWLDEAQFDLAQARQAAERVIRDGHRAGDIIASIRALARKAPTRVEPMDVRSAIRDVLLVLNGELRRRAVDARVDGDQREPLIILGDRTQLQQVLLNLIMNGVEAMGENGPVPRRLTVRSSAQGNGYARVCVEDTGSGLEPEHADRIFEAFYSTKPAGMGMGLSICRSIIEAHGGTIEVSASRRARGSAFSFTVPMDGRP
jgi:PAS domain S-box-containing protein